MAFNNGLTKAQEERLEMLAEECAEVVKCCMKILRHGYHSYNPDDKDPSKPSNQDHLTREVADVYTVLFAMDLAGDFRVPFRSESRRESWLKKQRYTHHQKELNSSLRDPA